MNSRTEQIRKMRVQGFKWEAISRFFSLSRKRVQELAYRVGEPKREPKRQKSKYAAYYPGVQQISDEAYAAISKGEPSDEMERELAEQIKGAKRQLFARHLAAMRALR